MGSSAANATPFSPSQKAVSKGKAKKELRKAAATRETALRGAAAKPDLLEDLGEFRTFTSDGVVASMDCYPGDQLAEADVQFCLGLLRSNMGILRRATGGLQGQWDPQGKEKALRSASSRVFMLRAGVHDPADEWVLIEPENEADRVVDDRRALGFLVLELSVERNAPSLLVLEMQLVPEARGKGLGKYVMQAVQAVASQLEITVVIYTNLKANAKAMQMADRANRGPGDECTPFEAKVQPVEAH